MLFHKGWFTGLAAGLLVATMLAGCLSDDLDTDVVDQTADDLLPFWFNDAIYLDVEVPVFMIGYDDMVVKRLTRELSDPEEVVQSTSDLGQPLPPDPTAPRTPLEATMSMRLPIVPTAQYDVVTLDPAQEAEIFASLSDWTVEGEEETIEGREFEDHLAMLFEGTGNEFDPNAPSIVLFNGAAVAQEYEWRYTMPHGHLQDVSTFGEYQPVTIIDTQKADVALENLDGYVREATHYRTLQGPVYPMPLPECHALTLVTAYRPTSLAEIDPASQGAMDLFHPEEIAGAFRNLTGTPVYVDTINLSLPMDDPVLDLIARGEFGTFEVQRAWIAENWQDYWVEHEGCEAYVSFLIHTDAASTPAPVIGIGTYDHGKGYRIAMSWVNDLLRLVFDPASPLTDDDGSMERFNWVDYLHTHEAGHIFGMMHPHHLSRNGVESRTDFQDVWSAMSYSTDGRVIDFGTVDQSNFQRNRAGFLFHAVHELGLQDEATYDDAIQAMSEYRWNDANAILWETLENKTTRIGGSLQGSPDQQDSFWFGRGLGNAVEALKTD